MMKIILTLILVLISPLAYTNGFSNEDKVKQYRKSVAQGVTQGQYNMGVIYANGIGVEKNEEEAVKWYRKAAAQGDKFAQKHLQETNKKFCQDS